MHIYTHIHIVVADIGAGDAEASAKRRTWKSGSRKALLSLLISI